MRGRSSPLSTVPRPPLPGPDSRHRDQPQLRRGRGPAPSRAGPGTQSHQKAVPGDLRSEGRGADSRLPPAAVPRAEHSPPADKLSAPSEPWPGRLHLQRAPEIRPRTLIALLAARARPEGRGQPSARSAAAAASRYQRRRDQIHAYVRAAVRGGHPTAQPHTNGSPSPRLPPTQSPPRVRPGSTRCTAPIATQWHRCARCSSSAPRNPLPPYSTP